MTKLQCFGRRQKHRHVLSQICDDGTAGFPPHVWHFLKPRNVKVDVNKQMCGDLKKRGRCLLFWTLFKNLIMNVVLCLQLLGEQKPLKTFLRVFLFCFLGFWTSQLFSENIVKENWFKNLKTFECRRLSLSEEGKFSISIHTCFFSFHIFFHVTPPQTPKVSPIFHFYFQRGEFWRAGKLVHSRHCRGRWGPPFFFHPSPTAFSFQGPSCEYRGFAFAFFFSKNKPFHFAAKMTSNEGGNVSKFFCCFSKVYLNWENMKWEGDAPARRGSNLSHSESRSFGFVHSFIFVLFFIVLTSNLSLVSPLSLLTNQIW